MGYDDAKKLADTTKEEKEQCKKQEERRRRSWLREGRRIMKKAITVLSSYHDKMTPQGRIKVEISGRALLDKKLHCSIRSGTKREFSQILFDLRLVSENVEYHDADVGDVFYRCWTFRNTNFKCLSAREMSGSVQSFSGTDFEDALDQFMAKYL